MKSKALVLITLVLSLIFSSCYKRNHWPIKGKGSNVTESRHVSDFQKIDLSIDADVIYIQDSIKSIEVSAQENILPVLETKVDGGALKISYRRDVWDHNRVKITVHSPMISGFNVSGSGEINAESNIKSSELDINISGSGNVFVTSLQANSLSAKISGSGNIKIAKGEVTSENLTVSGSGDIDCEYLEASASISKISGSGNIIANILENLKVTISGSGNFKYRGQPKIDVSISGSGRLIPLQ